MFSYKVNSPEFAGASRSFDMVDELAQYNYENAVAYLFKQVQGCIRCGYKSTWSITRQGEFILSGIVKQGADGFIFDYIENDRTYQYNGDDKWAVEYEEVE